MSPTEVSKGLLLLVHTIQDTSLLEQNISSKVEGTLMGPTGALNLTVPMGPPVLLAVQHVAQMSNQGDLKLGPL